VALGYADAKKEGTGAAGDYVLWRQLLDEATKRKLPVLLVTNDQKEDWYRRLHGITIGPRTELIAEMLDEAGKPFHAQTLERFLGTAGPLQRPVKETTVTEVRRIAEADRAAQSDEDKPGTNVRLGVPGLAAVKADHDKRMRLEERQHDLAHRAQQLQAMLDMEMEGSSADDDDPRSYRRTLLARLAEIRADQFNVEKILQDIDS
jgi:hypothetical protein